MDNLTAIEKCLCKLDYYSKKWRIHLWFKTFFGRLFHGGISESDLWNADLFLSEKIAKTVRRFAEMKRMGVPASVVDDQEHCDADYYEPIWEAILWKIVDGMERVGSEEFFMATSESYEQEAIELFAEFFFNLWD